MQQTNLAKIRGLGNFDPCVIDNGSFVFLCYTNLENCLVFAGLMKIRTKKS